MSFETWMSKALYDLQSGYYSKHVRTVGKRGDFSTSATISNLLAKGLARWIQQQSERLSSVRSVIEVGGGDGSLMRDLRKTLGWWKSRQFQWHMVETSPVLQDRQRAQLGKHKNITWHQTIHTALEASHGTALIYHNELVDAFPVKLLQWSDPHQTWFEVHLQKSSPAPASSSASVWQEILVPFEPAADITFSALSQSPSQPQQRVELHQNYHQWLHSWAPLWKNGMMLTIDYGDPFPAIYHRRPAGSLRSYFHHQTLTGSDIYQNMGHQDITCDVNFTDLIQWGHDLGWPSQPLMTQREFLLPVAPQHPDLTDQFLLDPYAAGDAFKVLVQSPSSR